MIIILLVQEFTLFKIKQHTYNKHIHTSILKSRRLVSKIAYIYMYCNILGDTLGLIFLLYLELISTLSIFVTFNGS